MRSTIISWHLLSVSAVLFFLSNSSIQAEDFNYDGYVAVKCSCPSPWGSNSCDVSLRDKFDYNISLAVRKGFSIDLAESCYRKRDDVICCREPRRSYSGTVLRHCPGKSSC